MSFPLGFISSPHCQLKSEFSGHDTKPLWCCYGHGMVGQLCKSLPYMNCLKPAGQAVCLSNNCMRITRHKHNLQMKKQLVVEVSGCSSSPFLKKKKIIHSECGSGSNHSKAESCSGVKIRVWYSLAAFYETELNTGWKTLILRNCYYICLARTEVLQGLPEI